MPTTRTAYVSNPWSGYGNHAEMARINAEFSKVMPNRVGDGMRGLTLSDPGPELAAEDCEPCASDWAAMRRAYGTWSI